MPVPYFSNQQARTSDGDRGGRQRPVVFIGISAGGVVGAHLATAYPHLVESSSLSEPPWRHRGLPTIRVRSIESFSADALVRRSRRLSGSMGAPCAQMCSEPGSRNMIEVRVRLGRPMPPEVFQNFFAHYLNLTPGEGHPAPAAATPRPHTRAPRRGGPANPGGGGAIWPNRSPELSSMASRADATCSPLPRQPSWPGSSGTSCVPDGPDGRAHRAEAHLNQRACP